MIFFFSFSFSFFFPKDVQYGMVLYNTEYDIIDRANLQFLFIYSFINMDLKKINLGYCKGGVLYCTNRHDAELMLWMRLSRVEWS